jgi:hypothetical protein
MASTVPESHRYWTDYHQQRRRRDRKAIRKMDAGFFKGGFRR